MVIMESKDHIEDNRLVMRFLQGECTDRERDMILKEASCNPEFKQALIELKNIYVYENMPESEASEAEYAGFKDYAMQRILLEENGKEAVPQPEKGRISRIVTWSAAAIIVFLLALDIAYRYIGWDNKTHIVAEVSTSSFPVESTSTLYTAKGVKGEVVLPDGSTVILNSDSRIKYPSKFTGSTRDVEFSGEGYFQVKKDSIHPMVVRCNKNFKVIVYGTTFNIKTYNNDNNAKTTLISGSIKIVESVGGKEFVRDMAPNQTYTIKEDRKIATLEHEVDTQKICQWKDGILSFDSTPLSEVAKILERWHGLQIVINDKGKLNIPITARFTTESIVQIMDLLKFSVGIDYIIDDNMVILK
ncbi:MAG: DUF4974 domain-containing protein [Bacteroidales bacterium]|nr:DUF4974 domain-containing protein [Bacteroidales bacterium]